MSLPDKCISSIFGLAFFCRFDIKLLDFSELGMNSVLKIPMKLSPEDSAALDGQSRICNWAYNHLLERAISERQKFITNNDKEAAKLVYSKRGLRDLLPELKKEHKFLQSVGP